MSVRRGFDAGTVTVRPQSEKVIGKATGFDLSGVKPGDWLHISGLVGIIERVESDTILYLKRPWPGPAAVDAEYDIQPFDPAGRVADNSIRLREILDKLNSGIYQKADATGTLRERAAHDAAEAGFVFRRIDTPPRIETYVKGSDRAGDWLGPFYPGGEKGEKGEKGDKGERGLRGPRGLQGRQGEKGDTGHYAGPLEVGTVTTGEEPGGEFVGEGENRRLNLVLPVPPSIDASVTAKLAEKADLTYVDEQLAEKADATDVDALLAEKADATDMGWARARIMQHKRLLDELDNAFILQPEEWRPSSGVFPGGGRAQRGYVYIAADDGTFGGTSFKRSDRIIALRDDASVTVLAGNWHKTIDVFPVLTADDITSGQFADSLISESSVLQYAAKKGQVERIIRTRARNYNLNAGSAGALIRCENTAEINFRIQLNSRISIPVNSTILVRRAGTGDVKFEPSPGVTLNSRNNYRKIADRHTSVVLINITTNVWDLEGNVGP